MSCFMIMLVPDLTGLQKYILTTEGSPYKGDVQFHIT